MSLLNFAQNTLKINIWSKMEEIFRAVESGERKILVRSCNGAGKTTALAAICNWYFTTYDDSIVLTTASSWMQVRRNLWGEIRRQGRKAGLYPKGEGIHRTPTSIQLSDKHFMLGISPNIPENAMGYHAPHILIAVDEATGINDEIMEALTGNMSGCDSQIVMICNPIDRESYPYQAEQSGEWKVIEISAFDHPNVIEGMEIIPGAVTRQWIEDRARSWSFPVKLPGQDSVLAKQEQAFLLQWSDTYYRKTAIVQARIFGQWAQIKDEGFIPLELIQRNLAPKDYQPQPVKLRAMGVDISRGVWRDGTVYTTFDVHDDAPDVQTGFRNILDEDLMDTADRIKTEYELAKMDGIELVIAVDDSGLGGGVTDRLKRLEIPFFPVNMNNTPKGFLPGKPLANARAEMFFVLHAELLEGEILLRDFPLMHRELSAIRIDIGAHNGSYKMESKVDTVKRLGRSPDYADATALARYALRLHRYTKKEMFL